MKQVPAEKRPWTRASAITVLLWLCALIVYLAWTNPGTVERVEILADQNAFRMVMFVGLWAFAVPAIVLAACSPHLAVRAFWALLLAVSGAAGLAFFQVSGNTPSIFDLISLWSARHEIDRAMDFYHSGFVTVVVAAIAGFAILVLTPSALRIRSRWSIACAIAPLVPIVAFAGMVALRDGGGSRNLPNQISPLSLGLLMGGKLAVSSLPERGDVPWQPVAHQRKHVVLVVDESVRADFIDWKPGNPYTPELAKRKDHLIDFGPAASGGNCSSYSNALLRFGASRHDLTHTILTRATIWQYAKRAGYRTVFIDAQAAFVKRYRDKMQNFMTAEEARYIDSFNAIESNVAPSRLDDRLADIILEELKSSEPVFIYAVKNGAHFPYDMGYPPEEATWQPVERESKSNQARVNSYRNVIKWSVDRVMGRIIDDADLTKSTIIYTSDHGQNLSGKALTHCSVENPDPREGLVPLFVATDDAVLKSELQRGAVDNSGRSSHFAIAPTMLRLFGYRPSDVMVSHGPSLFDKTDEQAAFISGDIFGLFSNEVHWNPIDLKKAYPDFPAADVAEPKRADGHAALKP